MVEVFGKSMEGNPKSVPDVRGNANDLWLLIYCGMGEEGKSVKSSQYIADPQHIESHAVRS
jgi:hypothetical protein